MIVRVKLSSIFRKYAPADRNEFDMEVKHGMTTGALMNSLGIPHGMERLFFVNERHAEVSTILNHGDRVTILPIVDGG